ncbi:hypothetical protein NHX12_003337 [Muraenolepis orangiensis]|uniref:Uncharacterized protein n=1 Tax=Muraenolepis orangiensis TaxID=630683 RepID=A0A9Q0IE16_9TELE|nr:hypothetical protein NHX12_003337 [Muraenolepis orangiensis]
MRGAELHEGVGGRGGGAHSSPTVPEDASRRTSLKDTLILIGEESDWREPRGARVSNLGAEACLQPIGRGLGRGRESEERAGELGHRKIPGLLLIGWVFAVQQKRMAEEDDGKKRRRIPQGHKGNSDEEGGWKKHQHYKSM